MVSYNFNVWLLFSLFSLFATVTFMVIYTTLEKRFKIEKANHDLIIKLKTIHGFVCDSKETVAYVIVELKPNYRFKLVDWNFGDKPDPKDTG